MKSEGACAATETHASVTSAKKVSVYLSLAWAEQEQYQFGLNRVQGGAEASTCTYKVYDVRAKTETKSKANISNTDIRAYKSFTTSHISSACRTLFSFS